MRKKSKTSNSSFNPALIGKIVIFIPITVIVFYFGIKTGSSQSNQKKTDINDKISNLKENANLRGSSNSLPTSTIESNANIKKQPVSSIPQIEEPIPSNPKIEEHIPSNYVITNNINKKEHLPQDSLKYSLFAYDGAYLTSPYLLDITKDTIVSAWVHLSSDFPNDNMRTIFSNKKSGCDVGEEQIGVAMFINQWVGDNLKVYLEYGDSNSGCNKAESADSIQIGKWTHLAVIFQESKVMLYIDGAPSVLSYSTIPFGIKSKHPLLLGLLAKNSADQYPLNGNISTFAVIHPTPDIISFDQYVANIRDIDKIRSIPGLDLLYQLQDAQTATPNSKASESVHHLHGDYSFPARSNTPGLKLNIVDGVGDRPVTPEMIKESDDLGYKRREKIKLGMKHAWEGYKKHAWGRDELKPISKRGQDNWGGMGVTLVDSLDTLWLMGMTKEFQEARDWVSQSLSFGHAGTVSVFETTIRELGGLLSAFDLSKDNVFLTKAIELGNILAKSFNSQSGIPYSQVDMRSSSGSQGWSGGSAILSELGSLQIEFRYLAQASGNLDFEHKSMKPFQIMNTKKPKDGLFPIKVNMADGNFADSHVTFGALGDSFYEYLLKVWIQGGKKESWLRSMYDAAMEGMINKLLKSSNPSNLAYISDWNGFSNQHKMDHLVCFMPGTLALGAYTDPRGLESSRAQRDLAVAKALMYTCYQMYKRMASGISAEYVEFQPGIDFRPGNNVGFYILRPETAESLFVLNQLTKDPIYREWAWEIWESIERECRTEVGYGSLANVQVSHGHIDDRMESFFLAETIKYLYLAQDPDKPVDLMKVVFNTEAHPMSVLKDSHIPIGN